MNPSRLADLQRMGAPKLNLPNPWDQLDELIRSGKLAEARRRLRALNFKEIPREQVATIADMARRLNMPRLALLILKPYVRPETLLPTSPSTRERALYAVCLSRLGVYNEAKNLLKELNPNEDPEVLFFRAANFIYQWDDQAAIPLLRRYIRSNNLPEYSRQVGIINLAECLISEEQWPQAISLIQDLWIDVAKDSESKKLLCGYIQQLAAQINIYQAQFAAARECIEKSKIFLSGSQSRYELYTKNWEAILQLWEAPGQPMALEHLRRIRQELMRSRHWEAVRNSEFFEALITRNDQLFNRVYAGTAHAKYRARILKLYQPSELAHPAICFEAYPLSSGVQVYEFNLAETMSPMMLRLFKILTQDRYRPLPLGSLVDQLYPQEFFNPISSFEKALQAVKTLRRWFRDQGVPLEVFVRHQAVKIEARPQFSVRVWPGGLDPKKNETRWQKLAELFGARPFTTIDVVRHLGISKKAASRLLHWALENRQVLQTAGGRTTRFKMRNSKKS